MLILCSVVVLVGVLAFVNGGNDNSKGVATLVGYGSATPRQALLWAMLTTAMGAAFSFWYSSGLIAAFKAKLFLPGTALDSRFFVAVLIGAIGWVLFATRTGMPVSTTHAIIGGLMGAGVVAFGRSAVVWSFLGKSVALPLVLSPLVSTLVVYLLAWPMVGIAQRYGGHCLCVAQDEAVSATSGGGVAVATPSLAVITGKVTDCATESPSTMVTTSAAANTVHWISGGFIGFARGWNDAPKITALSIVALTVGKVNSPAAVGFTIVTLSMAMGGYLAGRKVLETLSTKLTPLPLAESLTASIATAALVSAASWASVPVSTTHVSTGAIIGAGLKNDPSKVRWGKVMEIALSWAVTLPVAGVLAATAMWLLGLGGR